MLTTAKRFRRAILLVMLILGAFWSSVAIGVAAGVLAYLRRWPWWAVPVALALVAAALSLQAWFEFHRTFGCFTCVGDDNPYLAVGIILIWMYWLLASLATILAYGLIRYLRTPVRRTFVETGESANQDSSS